MTQLADLTEAETAITVHTRGILAAVSTVLNAGAALDRIQDAWDRLDHHARMQLDDVAPDLVAAILRMP